MNKRHSHHLLLPLILVVALVFCTTAALPVYAAGASSAQQAAQIAIQQNGGSGKVLGVSTETDSNGRRVFAVKVLSNGRVRVVRIPQN